MARAQTLGEIIKSDFQLLARCRHCDTERAVDLRMMVERFGAGFRPGESIERLREAMKCTSCGLKGARLEFRSSRSPGWSGDNAHSGHVTDDGWRPKYPPDDPTRLAPMDLLRISRNVYMERFRAIAAGRAAAWQNDVRRIADIKMITAKRMKIADMDQIVRAHPDWFAGDNSDATEG